LKFTKHLDIEEIWRELVPSLMIERDTKNAFAFGLEFDRNPTCERRTQNKYRVPSSSPSPSWIAILDVARSIKSVLLPKLINPSRSYGIDCYALGFVSIFTDPAGSSEQAFHEDVHSMDRHAIWNFMLPLDLPSERAGPVALNFRQDQMGPHYQQTIDDLVCWDANWLHKGAGNKASADRIQLHLIFFPRWMLDSREELPYGVDEDTRTVAMRGILKEYGAIKEIPL
jgi:hypothetical protein